MALVTERRSVKRKIQVVEELNELINQYEIIALAKLYKVRASQIQQLTQKFRKEVLMRAAKNNIIKFAFKKNKKKISNQ